jgi:hypothetical protein
MPLDLSLVTKLVTASAYQFNSRGDAVYFVVFWLISATLCVYLIFWGYCGASRITRVCAHKKNKVSILRNKIAVINHVKGEQGFWLLRGVSNYCFINSIRTYTLSHFTAKIASFSFK